jgi:hypothetical protein
MLDLTTAFQIVGMLMAATTHGEIYPLLNHFSYRHVTNLPFATADTGMGVLTSQFFIHLPSHH